MFNKILIVILSIFTFLESSAQKQIAETREYLNDSEELLPLSDVYFNIRETGGQISDVNGCLSLQLRNYNDKEGFIVKSFGKSGYILCDPNPDFLIRLYFESHPRKFIFKKYKDVSSALNKCKMKMDEGYNKYYIRTIEGLYKMRNDLKLQTMLINNKLLLASMSPYNLGGMDDASMKAKQIETEIIEINNNIDCNFARIYYLSLDFAKFVQQDKIDSLYFQRLSLLENGDFEYVFDILKKESQDLLKQMKIRQNVFVPPDECCKALLNNAKILSLGLSEERKMAEKIFKELFVVEDLSFRYEYAKFFFEYKPMENIHLIENAFKGFDLDESSVYVSLKVCKLKRDIYHLLGMDNKAVKFNNRVLSFIDEDEWQYIDDCCKLFYAEALASKGNAGNKVDDILKAYSIAKEINTIDGLRESVMISAVLSNYFLVKFNKGAPVEYIKKIRYVYDHYKYLFTYNEQIYLIMTLYCYYKNGRLSSSEEKYCQDELLSIYDKMDVSYVDLDEFNEKRMSGLYLLGKYDECRSIAERIIESNAFDHYKACAYYMLGELDLNNPRIAASEFMKASDIWKELYSKFPECKVYCDCFRKARLRVILQRK